MKSDLEELGNTTYSDTPQKSEPLENKVKPAVAIAAGLGLISFILPWLQLTVFGFQVFSVKGYEIPSTAEYVGQWTIYFGGNSNGVSVLTLLYLIPILFAAIVALSLLKKNRWIPLIGGINLVLLVSFLGGLFYNVGFNEALQLLSSGIYISLIAGIVLVTSKNW